MKRIGLAMLLMLGSVSADQVADAIRRLKSDEWNVIVSGARMLTPLGPDGKKAAPALVAKLGHEYFAVRKAMRTTLVSIGAAAMPALIKGMKKNGHVAHRREIATTIRLLGTKNEKYASAIIKLLDDPDETTRRQLAEVLARHSSRTATLLGKSLSARSANTREGVAWALGKRGASSLPMLRTATTHKNPRKRAAAALAIGYSYPAGKVATDDVRKLMADPDAQVRGAAAKALGRLGASSPDAIDDLVRALADSDETVRTASIAALTHLGPTCADALITALGDNGRDAARKVLVAMGKPAFAALSTGLTSENATIREQCALAFGEALPFDDVPLTDISPLLTDDVAAVRRAATTTFGIRYPSGWTARLIKASKDSDATVRVAALRALGRAKSTTKILEALRSATSDKAPAVKLAAEAALWNFGESSKVLDLAKTHLSGNDAALRDAACVAIRPMGRAAVALIPALVEAPPNRVVVDALGAITAAHGGGLRGRATRYARAPRETKRSIDAALDWLVKVQDTKASGVHKSDGRWDCGDFMDHRRGEGAGHQLYDAGVTGLAISALLAVGRSDNDNVREGVAYLIREQDAWGSLADQRSQHFQIAHAFALSALCEAWIVTGDPNCRRAAQRGVDHSVASRTPGGGWRYEPRSEENDTNVTVAMLSALAFAERGGLEVDPEAFRGGGRFIHSMTDEFIGYNVRGGTSARPEGLADRFPADATGSMMAAGIWGLAIAAHHGATLPDLKEALKWCRKVPPRWSAGRVDMYYWHYGSMMNHSRSAKEWKSWNTALTKALVPNQSRDRNAMGSWDPVGPWGADGGRIYSTAFNCLSLATPYRMLPNYWKIKPSGPFAAGAAALSTLAKNPDAEIAQRAALWLLRAGG